MIAAAFVSWQTDLQSIVTPIVPMPYHPVLFEQLMHDVNANG